MTNLHTKIFKVLLILIAVLLLSLSLVVWIFVLTEGGIYNK